MSSYLPLPVAPSPDGSVAIRAVEPRYPRPIFRALVQGLELQAVYHTWIEETGWRQTHFPAFGPSTDFAIGSTSDGDRAGHRDAAVDCTFDPGRPGMVLVLVRRDTEAHGTTARRSPRPLYILHPEVTTPWHLYRLGACRSAEALPCRGGNAGHLEMAVPSLPDIVSKPPAENSRGPRKRPHPHILGIPTDINIGSTGGHSAARPSVVHYQELLHWESSMSHRR